MTRILRPAFCVFSAILAGCADAQPTGTRVVVDPTSTQREAGASDDVLQVCQKMVNSMRHDPRVAAKTSKLILLDQDRITVDPNLHGYNARILYNQLTANLQKVAGAEFQFLDRNAVARERERQLKGEVKTSGIDAAPAGADLILDIELIAMKGGATNTVQYNFKLTNLDGIVVWTDNETIVKRN